ncbi:tRNA glutamyl-Q synthetase [Pedobacter yulinensis]|uniref:tRNA glutamyl-Q synthetase n=1 Tax=Pedobacter yulinensis TaxID=2126353 RepID=A0A2T3HNH2_9SPHI|nr:glutamate--tRNA ligase family protein [Pedobacter yulinensis]PST83957.1 tRNA glutamyl-Q synthetase [Pedobacter yulinensis]
MYRPAPGRFERSRIAPTPSGFLHLGNAYNFALTAALSRHLGARILLRIDDLDQQRVDPVYLEDIFETLHFLDIPFDEGPQHVTGLQAIYSQLHRLDLYNNLLSRLRSAGLLFACNCSRKAILSASPNGVYPGTCRNKELPFGAEGVAWRMRTDHSLVLQVAEPSGIRQATLPLSQRDFVVRKKDGFPAYQLASLADDLHFGVDLIVRGEDLRDSTLAQLYLARALEASTFLNTTFVHHPLLSDRQGAKLSKSAGSTSVQHLRRGGLSAPQVYGLIAAAAGLQTQPRHWHDFNTQALWSCSSNPG